MTKDLSIDPAAAAVFEQARPRLLGLAYRILGSLADAEDAVQDTFVKWAVKCADAERAAIDTPAAWLTTVCTRRCLDLLRAAQRTRVSYVGAWLPEPVQMALPVESELGEGPDLAASLTTAFLLMLERLTPKERAAFLLREVFDRPYGEIAAALDLKEAACRKLVSRAREHVERAQVRHRTPAERQDRLLAAFRAAVEQGATAPLAALLADDIRLSADGGGKVPALGRVLQGREAVMDFVGGALPRFWAGQHWRPVILNGTRAFLMEQDGRTVAAVTFAYDAEGQATGIFILRNPDKLAALRPVTIQ
ncbi:MAG TPA: sigma-70 family RNA polymerase sigma factor [Kiloniellaceae bacterium]|nr:sigma-70 family RNA polymerase sigma factor [Kiloniellaceae bacterium]HIP80412.1 sigma-70 family RNA polymerase sigma factor [Kiloniellaceae bacterium]